MRWRPALTGAVVQVTLFVPLFMISILPFPVRLLIPGIAGGAVAGWRTTRYGREYVDGAAGAVAGGVLSLALVLVLLWVFLGEGTSAGSSAFLGGLVLAGMFVVMLPVFGLCGAAAGYATGQLVRN